MSSVYFLSYCVTVLYKATWAISPAYLNKTCAIHLNKQNLEFICTKRKVVGIEWRPVEHQN